MLLTCRREQALSKADGSALDRRVQQCVDLHELLAAKIKRLSGLCEAFMSSADAQGYLLQLFQKAFPNALHSQITNFLGHYKASSAFDMPAHGT